MRRIIICSRCQRARSYFAKNMCRSCYGTTNKKKKRVHCDVCNRDNMPYAGPHICQSCRVIVSKKRHNSPERKKARAEKEALRRKTLGEKLREKERERGKIRRAKQDYREKRLQWQRNNKAYLSQYRKRYREVRHEKVKTWDQNKRARKNNAGILSPEEWVKILEKYNYSCYYCKKSDVYLEQEHKTPLSRGGKNNSENVVPACRECNAKKYTKTEEEFIASLQLHLTTS